MISLSFFLFVRSSFSAPTYSEDGTTLKVDGDGAIVSADTEKYKTKNFETITIGKGISSIDNNAFSGFTTVKNVNFADDYTAALTLGSSVFSGTTIATLKLPKLLSSIQQNTFDGMSELTTLELPLLSTAFTQSPFKTIPKLNKVTVLAPVSKIDNFPTNFFTDCTQIASINVKADSFTTIEANAFSGCTNLGEITFPQSIAVKKISKNAFANCGKLPSFAINEGDIDNRNFDLVIEEGAFLNCKSIISLNLGGGNMVITSSTFADLSALMSIELIVRSITINKNAFSSLSKLTSLSIKGDIITLETFSLNAIPALNTLRIQCTSDFTFPVYALNGSKTLTTLGVEGKNLVFQSKCFQDLFNLESFQIINSERVAFGADVFDQDSKLTTFKMHTTKDCTIDRSIFEDAVNLETFYFTGQSHLIIDYYAFVKNKKLWNVDFEGPILTINDNAFRDLPNLKVFNCDGQIYYIGADAFAECPLLAEFHAATIVNIDVRAFYNSDSLKELKCSSITQIGAYAFAETNIQRITIDGECSTIDSYAFANCGELVAFSAKFIDYIGSNAFLRCKKLAAFNLPSPVHGIGENAFLDCTALTDFTFLTIGTIYKGAFMNTPLKSFEFGNVRKSIEDNAFSNCKGINVARITNAIELGKEAFSGCTGLKEVELNDQIKLAPGLFKDCSALTSIKTNAKLDVPQYCFYGCSSLVVSSVVNAGEYSFYGCTSLTSIAVEGEVDKHAFDGCRSLTTFKTTSKALDVEDYAFANCVSLTKIDYIYIESVGEGSFENCLQLSSFEPFESCTRFGISAFHKTALSKVSITYAARIENKAFADNDQLTSVALGEVKTFGDHIFDNCAKLSEFSYCGSANPQGEAFNGCVSLSKVYVSSKYKSKKFFELPVAQGGSYCDGGRNNGVKLALIISCTLIVCVGIIVVAVYMWNKNHFNFIKNLFSREPLLEHYTSDKL